MAVDPNAPWRVPEWDDYINAISPYMGGDDEAMAADALARPLPPAPPAPTVEEQLAFKRAQYEREGMSPEEIEKAQAFNRQKYEEFERERTKPPPGAPKEEVDAWLASSPNRIAHIAQASGPIGTIGQIGHDPFSGQALGEVPIGAIDGVQTPPLLGEVDAVSGPAPSRVDQVVDVAGVDRSQPGATLDERLLQSEAPLPSIREREDEQGAEGIVKDLAKKSPEEQAMVLAKIQQAHDNFAASRVLEESRKTAEQQQELLRIRDEAIKKAQERRATLEAEAKQIADTNPTDTIPAYKKVFGVLAAFIGGFAANKTGRNMGLEVIDQIADEAAKQQAMKLGVVQKKLAGVGDDIASAEDTYRIGEAARIATYNIAEKSLQAEIQLYDPRGSTVARMLPVLQQIQAKRAELAQKYELDYMKRIEEAQKQQLELVKTAETQRHNIASERADATRAGADYLRAKTEAKKADAETQKLEPAYFAQVYGGQVPAELLPKTPMTEKQFKDQLQNTKEGREVATKIAARRITGVNPDGTDFIATAGGDEHVSKVRDQVTAYKSMVRLIDNARRIRTGWTSDTAKSKEWQELKTIWANAKGKGKNALGLGAMSDSDFALVGEYLGTDDPTKARGVEHAIVKARQLIIADANDALQSVGYQGKYDIPDLQQGTPTTSPEQFDLKFVLGTKHGEKVGEHDPDALKFQKVEMSDKQREIIDQWEKDAQSPDEATRVRAVNFLSQAAEKAALSTVKSYAKQAFDRVVTSAATPPAVEDIGDAPEVR